MSTTTTATLAQRGPDGLAVIGRTRHQLMGIRYTEGEGGNEGGDAAAQAAAKAAADAAAASASTPPWGDDPTKFDPDKAWKLIENLRAEVATAKGDKTALTDRLTAAEGKFDQFTKGLGGLLGFEEPETDPAKLQEKVTDLSSKVEAANGELTKAQVDIKTARLEREVAILAPTLGANAKLLLANEQFKTSIAAAEPTDEAAITAAIQKAVQDTPTLKATSPRSGGGEHKGAAVQTLEAQLAKAVESKDLTETIRLKRAIAAAKA